MPNYGLGHPARNPPAGARQRANIRDFLQNVPV